MTPTAIFFLLPLSPFQGFLHLLSQCQPPKVQGCLLALPAAYGPFLRKSHHYSMQWAFLPVKTALYFIDPSQPMLSPSRWLWSHSQLHFAPLYVTTPSPPSVRLRPSPHCLNLNPPVQLPGFCCNTHSNLSSFKSLHLQQLPPQGWEVQFLCKYLCPSRRFQELQLSPTSVQCSIKWTVYGNKLKMFTILYILYILKNIF